MKRACVVSLVLLAAGPGLCRGQVSGNVGFSGAGGRARAEQREQSLRNFAKNDLPAGPTSMFLEASVLLNVKADEHVAVFAISREGETLAECARKMDETLKSLAAELRAVEVADKDVFVDFIAQNKIYGFEVQRDILQEKLVGFDLKKNVSIRYQDPARIEKLVLAAAKAQVFDLVKVDYVVKNLDSVQDKLMEEAARVVKRKTARHEKLFGIKLVPPAQIYAEKTAMHAPSRLYDAYTAQESEEVSTHARDPRYTVRRVRKGSTFYFNPLDGDGFDAVIQPVITEPVVQFTLYLKMKYEIEQPKAK